LAVSTGAVKARRISEGRSVVPSPSPGISQTLVNGASCASPDACMAAGFFFSQHPNLRTLTLLGTAAG